MQTWSVDCLTAHTRGLHAQHPSVCATTFLSFYLSLSLIERVGANRQSREQLDHI